MIRNDKNELVPIRVQSGWRVYIDYRTLNAATRKDHFPLLFLYQMLEKLDGHSFYYLLDGYSCNIHVSIALEDHEKIIFTYPFNAYACRRMPFGLGNASAIY